MDKILSGAEVEVLKGEDDEKQKETIIDRLLIVNESKLSADEKIQSNL